MNQYLKKKAIFFIHRMIVNLFCVKQFLSWYYKYNIRYKEEFCESLMCNLWYANIIIHVYTLGSQVKINLKLKQHQ